MTGRDPESSRRYISPPSQVAFLQTWSKPSLPSWTSVTCSAETPSHRHHQRCAGSLPPVSKDLHRDRRSHTHFPSTPTRPPHCIRFIRLFGSPNGLCSSITITAVKEPWRRSSPFTALSQMLATPPSPPYHRLPPPST
jgi:hypothetical protein